MSDMIYSEGEQPSRGCSNRQNIERLERQLELINVQIAIAKAQKELMGIVSENPTLAHLTDEDRERKKRISEQLQTAVVQRAESIGIQIGDVDDVNSFLINYTEDKWCEFLSGVHNSSKNEPLPKEIVQSALVAYLDRRQRIDQSMGEAFELYKGERVMLPDWMLSWVKRRIHQVEVVIKLFPNSISGWLRRCIYRLGSMLPVPIKENDCKKEVHRRIRYRKAMSTRLAGEMRAVKRQHWIQRKLSWLQPILTGLAAVFMIGILAVGMLQLGIAMCTGAALITPGSDGGFNNNSEAVHPAIPSDTIGWNKMLMARIDSLLENAPLKKMSSAVFKDGGEAAMHQSLMALELILVAPLPYLLILGLTRYIRALAFQEDADRYRKELLEFKGFEISLFIAIIAAAVVSRVLKNKDGEVLTFEFAGSAALLIGVLSGYFYVVESQGEKADRLIGEHKNSKETDERKERVRSMPNDSE